MRKLFLLSLLPFLAFSPAQPRSLAQLRDSVGWVQVLQPDGMVGGCSAVSIGPTQWLTEDHCNKGPMTLNGTPTEVLKEDPKADLMLIKSVVAPPIEVSLTEPVLGEEVILFGWPHGWAQSKPLLFWGRLQAENEEVAIDGWPSHRMNFFHEGGGPGMSGGPILNKAGQLVGLTEGAATYPSVSVGSPTVKVIRKFLGLK